MHLRMHELAYFRPVLGLIGRDRFVTRVHISSPAAAISVHCISSHRWLLETDFDMLVVFLPANIMAKALGVLGGMGPLATVDFLRKLIEETPAQRDEDHIP